METIEFYFDFTSPYSYLAWKRLRESNLSVLCKPVMVGSIFSGIQSTGPGEIKSKREYLFLDCLRKARDIGVTMTSPKSLPFSPLPFLRAVISLEDQSEIQAKYIDLTFEYGWKHGLDYSNTDNFYQYIEENLGIDKSQHEELENKKESRRTLKLNIKEAIAKGLFGVPSLFVENRLYWGLDSIQFLEKELSSGIPDDLKHKLHLFQSATENI